MLFIEKESLKVGKQIKSRPRNQISVPFRGSSQIFPRAPSISAYLEILHRIITCVIPSVHVIFFGGWMQSLSNITGTILKSLIKYWNDQKLVKMFACR